MSKQTRPEVGSGSGRKVTRAEWLATLLRLREVDPKGFAAILERARSLAAKNGKATTPRRKRGAVN